MYIGGGGYGGKGLKGVKVKTLEVLDKVLRGKRIRPATQRHYKEALTQLAEFEEDFPVSGQVINEWINYLSKKYGYGDMTLRTRYDFAKAAAKYMVKTGRIKRDDNPFETSEHVSIKHKERRYFSVEELVRILRACITPEEKALILTLIDSTCRIGELVGLRGVNVDNGFLMVEGKTGQRKYRLNLEVCQMLKVLAGDEDGFVFKRGFGGRKAERMGYKTVSALQQKVRRIVVRAGITGEKLGPHTFRHSGGSLVAQETGSVLAVKAILQHDDIETSMRYIHDAEAVLAQKTSPLDIVRKRMVLGENEVQSHMLGEPGKVETMAIVPVYGGVASSVVVEDTLEEEFPEIAEGVEVRSLLKYEDLKLIRRAFINYCRHGNPGSDGVKGRELLKRMMRKVK